ncbi:MAG: hypothetical protein RL621_32 [Bacteroidota bacterium]|jgi:hypothetical protein
MAETLESQRFIERAESFNNSETKYFFLFLDYLATYFPNKLEFDGCTFSSSINVAIKSCRFYFNFTLKGYLKFAKILGNEDEEKLKEVWNYFSKNKDKLYDILRVLFGKKEEFEGEIDASFIDTITFGKFVVISFSTISSFPFNYNSTVLSCICYHNKSIDKEKFRKYDNNEGVKGGEPDAPLPQKTIKLTPNFNNENMFYQYLPTIRDTIIRNNTKYIPTVPPPKLNNNP